MTKRHIRARDTKLGSKIVTNEPFTPRARKSTISYAIQFVKHKGSYECETALFNHIKGQLGGHTLYKFPRFTDASDIEVKDVIIEGIQIIILNMGVI
jgi:hypothetical protein